MVGVTSIEFKENFDELTIQQRQASTPTIKEKLQVLYGLKQDPAPVINRWFVFKTESRTQN